MLELISNAGLVLGVLIGCAVCIIAVMVSIGYAYESRQHYLHYKADIPKPQLMSEIHQMHRWLAEMPVADAITTRLLEVAEGKSVPRIEEFRDKLRKREAKKNVIPSNEL